MLAQIDPHWTTIAAVWATVAIAIISVAAVVVNYFIFRSQIDPQVIVYATGDEARPTCILLIIENVGKGIAHDVRFELSRQLPHRAFGIGKPDAEVKVMMGGPLIDGIPSLGPGAKRVVLWGRYAGLAHALGEEVVEVTCRFRGNRPFPYDPVELTTACYLEVKSFALTDLADPDGARQSAKELKRIADALTALQRASGRSKVASVEGRDPRAVKRPGQDDEEEV